MSNVSLNSVEFGTPDFGSSEGLKPASGGQPGHFADALQSAIGEVDRLQVDADVQSEKVAHGSGNLHETSLALEKADVAMKLAMKVRNKVVDAYQDIMRMSI